MPVLAERDATIRNAIDVLGRPDSRRWQVFEATNGKLIAPEIAQRLGKEPSHVANELAVLRDAGLVHAVGKRSNAIIYAKIPDLRHTNLRAYVSTRKRHAAFAAANATSNEAAITGTVGIRSRSIEKVLSVGKKLGIENVNEEYIDALVVLNFLETVVTKFLMNHGYGEDAIREFYWDQKIDRLQDKLYEEAKAKGAKPRTMVLTVLKQLRTQRNDLDHEAHLPGAKIHRDEVDLIMKTMNVFAWRVLGEHEKYCAVADDSIVREN